MAYRAWRRGLAKGFKHVMPFHREMNGIGADTPPPSPEGIHIHKDPIHEVCVKTEEKMSEEGVDFLLFLCGQKDVHRVQKTVFLDNLKHVSNLSPIPFHFILFPKPPSSFAVLREWHSWQRACKFASSKRSLAHPR